MHFYSFAHFSSPSIKWPSKIVTMVQMKWNMNRAVALQCVECIYRALSSWSTAICFSLTCWLSPLSVCLMDCLALPPPCLMDWLRIDGVFYDYHSAHSEPFIGAPWTALMHFTFFSFSSLSLCIVLFCISNLLLFSQLFPFSLCFTKGLL